MRSLPIRLRLTAWYVLVIAIVLAVLTAFVATRLRSDLTSELDRSLLSSAEQIAPAYRSEGPAEFRDTTRTVLPESGGDRAGAQVLDRSGTVLLSEGDPVTRTPLIDRAGLAQVLAGRSIAISRRLGAPSEHLRIIAVSVRRNQRDEVVVVARSLDDIDDASSRVLVLLLAGSAGALAVISVGGWWIARKALRPVERMTRRADEIGLDFSQRINVPGVDDELGHLARTLNAMLDRLEKGVHARQRLVADASHELRAPLAAMRMELEVSLRHDSLHDEARALLASSREEVVRMSRIVDNLLTLAHVDEGHFTLSRAPEDLHALVQRAVRTHHAPAAAAGIDLVVRGDAIVIDGDRDRLNQVVSNLLDNAIHFAPRGSEVLVSVWRNGTEAGLTVVDSGPGVAAAARQQIFERFGRQDPTRGRDGGAGLGLAICSEIVRAHHGRIWVEDREPHGSTFVVALPRGPGARNAGALTS